MDIFDGNSAKHQFMPMDNDNTGSTNNNMDVMFVGPNNNHCGTNGIRLNNEDTFRSKQVTNNHSSCKTLQRKLELKVERAKKNYSQHSANTSNIEVKENSTSLIPIDRLPIPGYKENLPLVEYKSEHSDEDEVFSPFFPTKLKPMKKVDISDTFSIKDEDSDDSDDESRDSPNLELLPPTGRMQFLDKLINYVCCWTYEQ